MRNAWMFAGVVAAAWILSGSTPKTPQPDRPIEVAGADWQARAMAWFKSTETKDRRKEMRAAGKAIKRACRYCHTPDFKGYTDKRVISQQMMALSAEHGVTCSECHTGRETFSEMGEKAREMWTVSVEKKVFCDHCHVSATRFGQLTAEGKAYDAERKKGAK